MDKKNNYNNNSNSNNNKEKNVFLEVNKLMNVEDVGKMLEEFGMKQYATRFKEEMIDGDILFDLDERHFVSLGMTEIHSLKLVKKLKTFVFHPSSNNNNNDNDKTGVKENNEDYEASVYYASVSKAASFQNEEIIQMKIKLFDMDQKLHDIDLKLRTIVHLLTYPSSPLTVQQSHSNHTQAQPQQNQVAPQNSTANTSNNASPSLVASIPPLPTSSSLQVSSKQLSSRSNSNLELNNSNNNNNNSSTHVTSISGSTTPPLPNANQVDRPFDRSSKSYAGLMNFFSTSPQNNQAIDAGALRTRSNSGGNTSDESKNKERKFDAQNGQLQCMAVSKNESYIVVGGYKFAILLDALTGKIVTKISNGTNWLTAVAFAKDDRQIITTADDSSIKVWELSSSSQNNNNSNVVLNAVGSLAGHKDRIYALVVHENNNTVLTSSADKTIKIWDLSAMKLEKSIETDAHCTALAFSNDGKFLVGGHGSPAFALKIWNFPELEMIKTITKPHDDMVLSVAFHPDGKYLASSSRDKSIKIWKIEEDYEYELLHSFGHDGAVQSISFSPIDHNILASASKDKSVKIWDVEDGALLATITTHTDGVTGLSFFRKSGELATCSMDKTVLIRNVDRKTLDTNTLTPDFSSNATNNSNNNNRRDSNSSHGS